MYFDFNGMSEAVKFKDLLNHLGIIYQEDNSELRGKLTDGTDFIVNKHKNLFFCPRDPDTRGSIINFMSVHLNVSLTEAAKQIQEQLIQKEKTLLRDIPNLKLHYSPTLNKMGLTVDTCRDLEIGLVKERSVMAGKVAIAIKDSEGVNQGYIGWSDKGWYYPKGHKNCHVYNLYRVESLEVVLVEDPFEVARLYQEGTSAVALMSTNMTEAQELLLKAKFTHIRVLTRNPMPIVMRLVDTCYVKVA